MAEHDVLGQTHSSDLGPAAPKDPVEIRSGFFVLLDSDIEASERNDGKPSQEIYLEGEQLRNKARLTGGVIDGEILQLLGTCDGLRKLVHSIGVSIKSDNPSASVDFVLQNWGKKNKYHSGTLLRAPCKTDGSETIVNLSDVSWSPDDDVPGKFAFELNHVGDLANASIKLYLHNGYQVPEFTTEQPVAFGTGGYQAMISRSLLNKGNNRRLKRAIEKARCGESVTIAYIGGSVTQGAGAKPIHTNCYAYKSYVKFQERFGRDGGENIIFVKAGVGGTPSELGIIRYHRDVLRDGAMQPDIVIVEFAVNDAGDETNGKCYESLCLKILSEENGPAVILLFSVFVNDWNLQDRLSPVGFHYDLPMVSVKDSVVEQFRLTKEQGNIISKRRFFYDIYHPTNDGHTVMADCLDYLFSETAKSVMDEEDIHLHTTPIIGSEFKDVRLLDKKDNRKVAQIDEGSFTETDTDLQMVEMDDDAYTTPQFPHNWMHTPSSGQASFKMRIRSKNLLLVYKDSGSSQFGKAEIWVDGNYVRTADPHANNWTHCNTIILYQEDTSREHTVEIRMTSEDAEKCFTILGFGVTV